MADMSIKSVLESILSLYDTLKLASFQNPPPSVISLPRALLSFNEVLGSLTDEARKASEKFGNLKLSLKQLGKEIVKCETIISENQLDLERLNTQLDPQIEKIQIHVSAINVELQPRCIANITALRCLEDRLGAINVKLQDVIGREIETIRECVQSSDENVQGFNDFDDLRNTRSLLEEERAALENSLDIFARAGKKALITNSTAPVSASSGQTSDKEPGVSPEGRKTIHTDVRPNTNAKVIQIGGSMPDAALLRELGVQIAERQNYEDANNSQLNGPCTDEGLLAAIDNGVLVTEAAEPVRARSAQTSDNEPGVRASHYNKDINVLTGPQVDVGDLTNDTTGERGTRNSSKPDDLELFGTPSRRILDLLTPDGGRQRVGLQPNVRTTIRGTTVRNGSSQTLGYFSDKELQKLSATVEAKSSGRTESLEQKIPEALTQNMEVMVRSPRAPFRAGSHKPAGTGPVCFENIQVGPGEVYVDVTTPEGKRIRGSFSNDADLKKYLDEQLAETEFDTKYGVGHSLVENKL